MWHAVGSQEVDINKKDFSQGLGESWTVDKIKNVVGHNRNWLLPAAAYLLATKPAGYIWASSIIQCIPFQSTCGKIQFFMMTLDS
jgi:hypothetical protein